MKLYGTGKWLLGLAIGILLLANNALAVPEVNQDYLEIRQPPPQVLQQMPAHQVTVIEFFSYGCPACFHLEPALEKWSTHLPKYVHFYRIPVQFEPDWQVYARAYYVAQALGVDRKLDAALFEAIQQKRENLTTLPAMTEFFVQHGVNREKFVNMYESSPAIDMQMAKGKQLIQGLIIFQIPTLVIDGKYRVDPSLAGGNNQKLLATVNYLIAEQAKAKHL